MEKQLIITLPGDKATRFDTSTLEEVRSLLVRTVPHLAKRKGKSGLGGQSVEINISVGNGPIPKHKVVVKIRRRPSSKKG